MHRGAAFADQQNGGAIMWIAGGLIMFTAFMLTAAAWARSERLISPPTIALLEAIRGAPVDELGERARPLLEQLVSGALPPIRFAPDVDMLPRRGRVRTGSRGTASCGCPR